MIEKKHLLWVGAGDLAQRTLPYLDQKSWQTTAVNRHGHAVGFNHSVATDITDANNLSVLPFATHVLYSVTPSGRNPENYATVYDIGLKNLLGNINTSRLERFIFISSTAVYGPKAHPQNEHSSLHPSAFNGKALVKAEQLLRDHLGSKLTIIRFSGLYGPERNYFFNRLRESKVTINPAPDNYANRIHIEDAARVCAHVLQLEQTADSYLGTDSTPLSLSKLYAEVAQWLKVPAPRLDQNLPYESKHFSNQGLINSGFHFLYPNTLMGYQSLLV